MDQYTSLLAHYEKSARRILLIVAFFLVPISQSMNPQIVKDADIWWHLRAGQWIVEHGTVPQNDPFSVYGQGKPWVAYSWLFELLIYGLYRLFGMAGPIIYTVTLWLAIATLLLAYLRRQVPKLVNAVALAGLGLLAMQMAMPRPWLFTILFFIAELGILLNFRQTGNPRQLLFLPPIFALWANIHIQFIYGLFVIALVSAEPLLDRMLGRSPTLNSQAVKRLCITLAACLLATLVNPYHLKVYLAVYEIVSQTTPFRYIVELQSPDFHDPWGWFILLVTVGAVFALGWRREGAPLPILLLLAGILLAFRAQRDMWFLSIVAVAIIASGRSAGGVKREKIVTRVEALAIAVVIVMTLFLMSRVKHLSAIELEQLVSQNFPEAAVKVVEKKGYCGPLYNHFNWGGYLMWRLHRLPVAMDGRTNLHGEERLARSVATWSGGRQWVSDPELASAQLVVASQDQPLTSLLRLDHRFELVYEDQVAAVFIARPQLSIADRQGGQVMER